MVLSKINIYITVLVFSLLRPSLYYYSPMIARAIEAVSVLIITIMLVSYGERYRFKYFLFFMIASLYCLFVIQVNSFFYISSIKDLFELFRPLMLFVFFMFGYSYYKNFGYPGLVVILRVLSLVGVINVIICALQFLFPESFSFLYKIYNVNALLYLKRPAGIGYSHTEIGGLSGIFSICCFLYYLESKKRIYVLLSVISIFASFASLSKSPIVFVVLLLFFGMLLYIFFLGNFSTKIVAMILCPVILGSVVYLAMQIDYIYYGFEALIDYKSTGNGSVTARLDNYQVLFDVIKAGDYRLFIGSSPLRAYDHTYIEVSSVNIMFRFGLIGFIVYYLTFAMPLLLMFNLKRKFNGSDLRFYLCLMLSAVFLAMFATDFTSNFSETIKFSSLYFFFVGIVVSSSKYHNKC